MAHHNKGYVRMSHHVGIFIVMLWVLCLLWYYVQPAERALHVQFFRLSFYGFTGINAMSFISATVQSYIWGYIFVGLWEAAHRVADFGFE